MKPIIEAKGKKPTYDGTAYDSKEEIWFLWYLLELQAAGYIESFECQPEAFILSCQAKAEHFQCNAKTRKKKAHNRHQAHEYTADFKVVWNRNAEDTFYGVERRGIDKFKPPFWTNKIESYFGHELPAETSWIEIKPAFDKNKTIPQFVINQKWVRQSHGIDVQKIITTPKISKDKNMRIKYTPANALFTATFTPERFRFTDKSMKKRTINFYAPSLHDYAVTGGRMPF